MFNPNDRLQLTPLAEIMLLKERIAELEARLATYENHEICKNCGKSWDGVQVHDDECLDETQPELIKFWNDYSDSYPRQELDDQTIGDLTDHYNYADYADSDE